jgi:hypothetical protein
VGANVKLFWILAGFFFLADAIYIFWSLNTYRLTEGETALQPQTPIEWVGAIGIALTGLLSVLIAFYLQRLHRAQGGELPEDRLDANIDDGDAEQGFFSPWSWWPLVLAFGAALVFLGLAVGVWVSLIGGPIAFIAIVGWVYEYYRLNFAR